MILTRTKTAFATFLLCAIGAPASAQQLQWTDKAFVTANVGGQVGSHNLTTTATPTIYDETATIVSSGKTGGGPFFDVGFGYKVWHNVAAGATYSWMSDKTDIAIAGSIPDPIFFDRPRAVTASASGAKHIENALHLNATWMMPVTDKIDVGISGGPTIYFVKQDIVSDLTVTEPGPTIQTPTFTRASKTTGGFNLGVDVTYLVGPNWGVGGTARYGWGSVKLTDASSSLTVGGLQLGVGFRYRLK
jgi:hypothetical protein